MEKQDNHRIFCLFRVPAHVDWSMKLTQLISPSEEESIFMNKAVTWSSFYYQGIKYIKFIPDMEIIHTISPKSSQKKVNKPTC